LDWKRVEETLRRASADAIAAFAAEHRDESFYAFAFDCNADYGEVFLCLNTEADLAATVRAWLAADPARVEREIESDLRWNVGDWKYHAFNINPPCEKGWEKAWSETEGLIHDATLDDDDGDEIAERFLVSACRVMVAMEKDGVLDVLRRDPGFKTLVGDHDEPIEDSWARLLRVRNQRRARR
jgi:hypothetical protein